MTGDMIDKLQKAIKADGVRNLPKRFYTSVDVAGEAPALSIQLDGRGIKTPMKASLAVPTVRLANAVAAEWDDQDEHIDPATMPLTRLCNTAIDRIGADPSNIIAELTDFAGSDLICYRAETPQGLVERQQAAWDPLFAFAEDKIGAGFISVCGLMHQPQPGPAFDAMKRYYLSQSAFSLTAVHNITTLTGSSIIAAAVQQGRLDGDQAWAAAHVDEDWQIEHWGTDDEAVTRRAGNRREFDAALRLLELLYSD